MDERSNFIKYDPIEDTEEYKNILDELEEKVNSYMKLHSISNTGLGSCHRYWNIKKEILRRDYNIDWKSPAELNEHIIFD